MKKLYFLLLFCVLVLFGCGISSTETSTKGLTETNSTTASNSSGSITNSTTTSATTNGPTITEAPPNPNKLAQSITNISDISKVCDGTAVTAPTYNKLGDGDVTISYYKGNALLTSAPKAIGNYKVRVSVAEGTEYNGGYAEREFKITLIVDHTYAKSSDMSSSITLSPLNVNQIAKINATLKIAYFHTSHGRQMVTGTDHIKQYLNSNYVLSNEIYYDNGEVDAGTADVYTVSKNYLDSNSSTNVIIWAWCGQLCWMTETQVNDYIDKMERLEEEYPNVIFVYMTGHAFNSGYDLGGGGRTGTEAINTANNQIIRSHCVTNNKVLFDFEKMDMYDPAGNYYGDDKVRDDCTYDKDGDGTFSGNWTSEWSNTELSYNRINSDKDVLYKQTYYNHTTVLSEICKAYAFWNMLYLLSS